MLTPKPKSYHPSFFITVFIILFLCASSALGTWKQIANLNYPIGCCFFFDDLHGFVGSGNQQNQYTIIIWYTNDGGLTWGTTSVPNASGQVTQISIRSDGIGYASIYTTSSPFMNLWKTTDGGASWTDATVGTRLGTGVGISYSVPLTKASWVRPPDPTSTNGVFFMDDKTVLVTPGPKNNSAPIAEAWSAWGDSTTRIWYAVTELSGGAYYSLDNGKSWKLGAQIAVPTEVTGHIFGSGGKLYAQTTLNGMVRGSTSDTGRTWHSVGGPTNVLDTRTFYVGGCVGQTVIAFDQTGAVWKTIDGGDGTLAVKAEVAFTHPTFTQIGACKNELRILNMTNEHCYNFLITSISFDVNPSGVFTLTAPAVPDTLHSTETQNFQISFDPSYKPGAYTAKVHVSGHFLNGLPPVQVDSIFAVTAIALAEQPQLVANPSTIDFDTVPLCGGKADTSFTLQNIGCDTILITSGPGALPNDYTIDNITLPYKLPPDSSIVVHAHFKPSTAGTQQTFPKYTATGEGLTGSVQMSFTAFGEDGRALMSVSPASIIFDTISICDMGDSALVKIKNTGCVPLLLDSITLAGDKDYSLGGAKTTSIAPQDSVTVWIYFSPQAKNNRNATITIVSHSQSVDSTVMRSAIGVKAFVRSGTAVPVASVSSVDFGTMTSCESRDTTFTITNTGCDTLIIGSGQLSGAGFAFGSATFPDTILAKGKLTITIHAVPDNSGASSYTGSFIYTTSDSGYKSQSIPLSFSVKNNQQKVNLWLTIDNPSGTAATGTTVHLKCDPAVIAQYPNIDVTLSLDQDLLGFLGTRGANQITQTSGAAIGPVSYHISGSPLIKPDPDSSIALFDYFVYLTKDSTTNISLTADKINNIIPGSGPCAVQATTSGTSFAYVPKCSDGLIQDLLQGNIPIRITSISPNPVSGEMTVEILSRVSASADISIVSVSGAVLLEKSVGLTPSSNGVHLSVNSFANGTYLLVVKSQDAELSQKITIQK